MPEIVQQRNAPPPPSTSPWGRLLPWVVVYGLVLAILFFFSA